MINDLKTEDQNVAVIILSCDKYFDTWEKVIYSFDKYWGHSKYPIYITTNNKKVEHSKIICLNVGDDISWSSNLQFALKKINENYIILWLDDVFLNNYVSKKNIEKDINWFRLNDIDYLRLRNDGYKLYRNKDKYERISEDDPYRNSIFCTLWKKKILEDVLVAGENAWQFEFRGSIRSTKYKNYYTVNATRFSYLHAIEKGVWLRKAIKWIYQNNLNVDLNYRSQMNLKNSIYYNLAKIKGFLLNCMAPKYKKITLRVTQKIYTRLRLRPENYYSNK
jgi:hypothetical protein